MLEGLTKQDIHGEEWGVVGEKMEVLGDRVLEITVKSSGVTRFWGSPSRLALSEAEVGSPLDRSYLRGVGCIIPTHHDQNGNQFEVGPIGSASAHCLMQGPTHSCCVPKQAALWPLSFPSWPVSLS